MKIYIYLFIFVSSVYTLNQCKCKYNQEQYFDCCVRYEKEKINRYSGVDLYGIMFFGAIKGQQEKLEPSRSENKHEDMEGIEYPKVKTINELSEIIEHNQQIINNEAYNIWLNLINKINTESNNNLLRDNSYWDTSIKSTQIWNQLPENYQQMTQLFRKSLYFKNNLVNLQNKEYENKPMEDIIYQSNYLNNIYDDDIISKLNSVKQIFHRMYNEIIVLRNVEKVKEMYNKWNNYININLKDDYNIPFQSSTSRYLAIIVGDWIEQWGNQITGEKPEKIEEQIIGKKHDREDSDDEDRKRTKS
jgi:hypothetical protein